MAVNPESDRLYVAGLREVWIVDLEAERVEDTIDVRGRPSDVAVNRRTDMIYVTGRFRCSANCWPRGLLSVIDGSSNQVVSEIRVGKSPGSVAVNPRTNQVFVANYNSENISVVDGSTNEVVSVVDPQVGYPVDLAVNSRSSRLYVTGTEKLSVLDIVDERVVWSGGPASGYDLQVEVDPGANQVYLTDEYGLKLWILDGSSHRAITAIELSQEPVELAVDAQRNLIHVTTWPDFYSDDGGELVSVDTQSFETVNRAPVGDAPWQVAVDSDTLRVYVGEDLADTVWVISEEDSGGPAGVTSALGMPAGTQGGAGQMTRTCDGEAATKVGTPGDDVILGTARRDVIVGFGGDDVIKGRGQRDKICGNRGADHLFGGKGIDEVVGGIGRDRLEEKYIGGGNSLDGGPGRDTLGYVMSGPVVVLLGPGEAAAGCPRGQDCPDYWDPDFLDDIEKVVGSRYDDNLSGDDRRDLLRGKRGRDRLWGHGGDDRLLGGPGRDKVDGGDGRDVCRDGRRRRCEG